MQQTLQGFKQVDQDNQKMAQQSMQALEASIQKSELGVQQSKQVQAHLQQLVTDIIDAAKTDKDAQQIIKKYGIQVNGTTSTNATNPQ
jgi:exonuclease VII small subunit